MTAWVPLATVLHQPGETVRAQLEFVVVFVTDDQLLSPYQFVMSVRMYVMCGMYVERQIGPVWGLSYWSRLRMIFVWACATCP